MCECVLFFVHTHTHQSLSVPKKTMNIAGFIAACKKLGVPEALVSFVR